LHYIISLHVRSYQAGGNLTLNKHVNRSERFRGEIEYIFREGCGSGRTKLFMSKDTLIFYIMFNIIHCHSCFVWNLSWSIDQTTGQH